MLPAHVRDPDPSLYLSDNYVVVDFETTTIDFGTPHNADNTVILASWSCGPTHPWSIAWGAGVKRTVGTVMDMAELVDDIRDADFFVAHYSKFEWGWLERCGLELTETVAFCTKIAEKVLAGNRFWKLSLSDCLERRGMAGKDPIGKLIRLGVDTLNIPIKWLGKYCDQDVTATEALFLDQRAQLQQDGLMPVAYTRNLLTPCLYDIEKRGLHLNKERVDLVHAYYMNREARLTAEWNEMTGGVNPKSNPQKRALLLDDLKIPPAKDDMGKEIKTDGGDYSVGSPALKQMKLRTKQQKQVVTLLLDLVSTRDALSKYVTQLKNCADNEGILYGTFVQTTAATHRLSSTGRIRTIQLQNFQTKFRPCISARTPGWRIGDGDAANIEFRAAIDLAKDGQGIADIKAGVDIHANTARTLYPGDWDETIGPKVGANKVLRQRSKANTFKPLYGGQSGTRLQRAYFAFFRERYTATSLMQRGWTETVLRTRQLRVASGLIFYWPDCALSRDGKYIKYTTNIYDYPVQSLATAEMCPTSTLYLWHMMKAAQMQSFLIDIVHDSAVGEIHPDEVEQWTRYLEYCFNELIVWYLKKLYAYEWVTPLESEVAIGEYWNEPPGWVDQWKPKES